MKPTLPLNHANVRRASRSPPPQPSGGEGWGEVAFKNAPHLDPLPAQAGRGKDFSKS